MSATTPVPPAAATPAAASTSTSPGWLREPLLHFVLLGAVLFAADQLIAGSEDDPRTIVVDAAVDREAAEVFKAARGREPNAEEAAALRRTWLDNEVLYREGLAMQVDRGDTAIRERVIFKALSVIDAGVRLPQPDDKLLREWFEKRRDKYDQPARYDFQEAVLAGQSTEEAIRAFVRDLNSGTPGDARAGLRVFTNRPHGNLVQSYGPEFPAELAASRPQEWTPLKTRDGWRAIRPMAVAPAAPADYESLRGVVLQDWKDATASEQRSAAVRELAKQYKIKVEAPGE